MSSGEHSFTATGRMRRATYAEVCQWIAAAWKKVPERIIVAGFIKAGLVPAETSDSEMETDTETDTSHSKRSLSPALAALFQSDSEESDFDGFPPSDDDEIRCE